MGGEKVQYSIAGLITLLTPELQPTIQPKSSSERKERSFKSPKIHCFTCTKFFKNYEIDHFDSFGVKCSFTWS